MMRVGIHNGDLLVVDRVLEPVHGDIVIAALNGELTCKILDLKGLRVNQLAVLEEDRVTLTCVAIEEILAEKVLSFLRRYASHFDNNQQNTTKWDSPLVRHIYDIYCIVASLPSAPLNALLHFKTLFL